MNKKFFQHLMFSICCLIILSSSPLFADVFKCATIRTNSKGTYWVNFTYISCKDGRQQTAHPDGSGWARADDAAIGTFLVSIGPVGTSTNYIEGREIDYPIKSGYNTIWYDTHPGSMSGNCTYKNEKIAVK